MTFSLFLDIFLAILLVVMIGYAVVLNRRLGEVRRDKSELENLASSFGDSTLKAGESIVKLKNTADDLKERIEKAGTLRDDLVFLLERGTSTADRLEEAVRAAREERPPVSDRPSSLADTLSDNKRTVSAGKPRSGDVSRAERELIDALKSAE